MHIRRDNYLLLQRESPMNFNDLWLTLNWSQIEKEVNKLQSRIAKAIKRGAYYLVKKLQHLLKNSFYAKLLTVRKVTSNKGKRTAGIDKKLWTTPASKWKAVNSLKSKGYKAMPLRRIFIEKKGKKKQRPLGIPTMYDRAMQALHALTLDPVAETIADKRSFGFRKFRSCQDAGQQIFNCLSGKNGAKWILEGDIKGCFDNINHKWLVENIPMDKKVLKEFLKSGYVFNNELFPTENGTPQGGIISPILANMALDGIEEMLMKDYWTSSTGRIDKQQNKENVNFIRYADDFIVTAKNQKTAEEIQEKIKKFIFIRGLELSEEKTTITHVEYGFDFLGWNIRKINDKLLIKPSKDSCKTIANKIRAIIRKSRTITQDALIYAINPIIRGWCNYHRCMVSKKIFQQLDTVVFKALWKWSKRRHPMKTKQWIKNKYFKRIEFRDWIFHGEKERILFAGDTKIKRHRMIKLDRNPYLKQDKEYYLNRKKKKNFSNTQ